MLIIISMVIPTIGFIAAGSVDPRMHMERRFTIVADHPYPLPAVLVSCGLVLAEGLVLALILMRARPSLAWRALLAGLAAGILATEMRSATLGLPSWYGYVTYHFLWLVCAAALMFALVLVGAAAAAFRRFCRTAPANPALQRTALAPRR